MNLNDNSATKESREVKSAKAAIDKLQLANLNHQAKIKEYERLIDRNLSLIAGHQSIISLYTNLES